MSSLSHEMHAFIAPWLQRVTVQFEPKAKEAEKKYDSDTARSNLETSTVLGWIISANQRPAVQQNGLVNVHNVQHHHHHETHHHTHINSKPSTANDIDAESTEEKKAKKKEEVNWKNIVVITFFATAVTSISVFVYTRLAKTQQRAQNYLDKTQKIKEFAENPIWQNNNYMKTLKKVAVVQEGIDKNAVDKIAGYKRATVIALVGTVTVCAGGVAMPWFAAASTIAIIAGGIIGAVGSAACAAYNLANHWSDKSEAEEKLAEVKHSLDQLNASNSYVEMHNLASVLEDQQPAFNPHYTEESPPPYEETLPPSYAKSQEDYGYGYLGTESFAPTAPPSIYPTLPEKDGF